VRAAVLELDEEDGEGDGVDVSEDWDAATGRWRYPMERFFALRHFAPQGRPTGFPEELKEILLQPGQQPHIVVCSVAFCGGQHRIPTQLSDLLWGSVSFARRLPTSRAPFPRLRPAASRARSRVCRRSLACT
jgi:hypothetical protein